MISLLLALILWAVVRKSIEATGLPSKFRFDMRESAAEKFDFSSKKP